MNRRRSLTLLALVVCALARPGGAAATWSITAVDPRTRQVGIAGASCTDFVYGIAGVAPGKGVIVAQAMSNMEAKSLGQKMLLEGASPRQVLAAITDPAFDSDFAEQQYGIVALGFEDEPATYTGGETPGWKGDLKGHAVSVQGNILTGGEVLKNALAAFERARDGRATLADRLVAALEAGTAGGGGDRRCGAQRARSAFVVVEQPRPDGRAPYLLINVTGHQSAGANPVELLRRRYDEWRRGR